MPEFIQTNTKRRSDCGSVQATDRDLYLLQWLGQMYAARLDHVQVLGALKSEDTAVQAAGQLGYSAVKNIYRRWLRAGWVEKQKLLVRQATVALVEPSGLTAGGAELCLSFTEFSQITPYPSSQYGSFVCRAGVG